jgi:hypothetical protein
MVGVISDTHSLLRPEAVAALADSALILHAGDIVSDYIVENLQRIAPVVAVRGNCDPVSLEWTAGIHATETAEAAGKSFYLLHNLEMLDLKPRAAGFDAVIFGHTHQPGFHRRDGVLYFNPGSAGPRRTGLPVSVGRIFVEDGELHPEIVELRVG